jgi:hypothetical protein
MFHEETNRNKNTCYCKNDEKRGIDSRVGYEKKGKK